MNTTFLVDLLVRFILRSHRAKKLPYVYLANDLIQKSKQKKDMPSEESKTQNQAEPANEPTADGQHFNDFHKALAPPKINKVLESLFTMLA